MKFGSRWEGENEDSKVESGKGRGEEEGGELKVRIGGLEIGKV